MELPTSTKERVVLLEAAISSLLTEVWGLNLNLKILGDNECIFCWDDDGQLVDGEQLITEEVASGEALSAEDDEQYFNDTGCSAIFSIVITAVATLPAKLEGIVNGNAPPGWALLQQTENPLQPLLAECLNRLVACFSEDKLGSLAADMYFNPSYWQDSYSTNSPCYQAIKRILTACLFKFSAPPDMCDRLTNRLKQILEHPFDRAETKIDRYWRFCRVDVETALDECLELLLALTPGSESLDFIEKLVLGEMNFGPFNPSSHLNESEIYYWQQCFDSSVYPCHFNSRKSVWAYQIYDGHRFDFYQQGKGLCDYFPQFMERLHAADRFSYESFCQCVQHLPAIVTYASHIPINSDRVEEDDDWERWKIETANLFHSQVSPAFSQVILGYCDRLAWETAQNLSQDNYHILTQMQNLRGSRYLLQAARQHADRKLGTLVLPKQPQYSWQQAKKDRSIAAAIIYMARAANIEPESIAEHQSLVEQLKTFPADSLKALLPFIPNSQVLCEALDWQQALPLINAIAQIAAENNTRCDWSAEVDITVAASLRQALRQAGVLAREVWQLWRQAKAATNNTVLFVEAIAGWNRDEIERSLLKRKQLAVKAYGLLPLKKGKDEVLERYLFLQQFQKESRRFGAERQANEQAAVQSALTYLAQVAGFASAKHLECLMEAGLNQKIGAENQIWSVGEYQVELAINSCEPQLIVRRGGKQLKSVPAVVRQARTYAEIREIVKQLRSQVTRFRHNFEEMMAIGQPLSGDRSGLSADELATFSRLPLTREMLSQLILLSDDACGLFLPDAMAVQTLDGASIPLAGKVCIAHPYHLFHRGELAAWQQEIVRQRIVQPFKQVFRELYLLTPAEQETRTYSNRFAGHSLDSRVAAKLLQSRGWQTNNGEYAPACKVFPDMTAYFEFPDAGHYMSETEAITSDRIYFLPDSTSYWDESHRLPLADVPPLIFSEVMRDADLVISVAQKEGELRLSAESYQRRGELVQVLLADLGLPGVKIEGHFARVQGKLANYRVHLGSAAIHIEPGHYLCIVPQRWGQKRDRLFLPFVDGGDNKISEVISKILLLANDHKIEDESILRQIKH